MKQLKVILAILATLILLLLPMAVLADTAPESVVDAGLVWGEGININATHNTWYSADRHWVSYVYGGNVWVSSTADYGSTWDAAQVSTEGNTTFRGLAIWYDEPSDIVHFARVADGDIAGNVSDVVYHSAYIPLSSGSLMPVQTEVAVEDGTYVDGDVGTITIACDELGYPWIAWTESEYTSQPTLDDHYWVEISDSDTNDGTWVEGDADGWYEFDGSGAAALGHDYDALYGEGNWTAVAVNLCPIDASGDLMQVAWSIDEDLNGTVGIDSAIWNGTDVSWGNLSWVVPPDGITGLFPTVMGEIEFDFYDIGSAIHVVYADWVGDLNYNVKAQGVDWDDINGAGNWTEILDYSGFPFPSLSGYDAPGIGEDIICIYHDMDSLYYKTKSYAQAWDAAWTLIWDVDDHTANPAHGIFMQNTQYKYGTGSPVGFAWNWGTLEWGNGTQTGELDYWWIDQDGVAAGENVLGWYSSGVIASTWVSVLLKMLLDISIACGLIIGVFKFDMGWQAKLGMIVLGLVLIAIVNSLL
jgi:hypothetical protein